MLKGGVNLFFSSFFLFLKIIKILTKYKKIFKNKKM